MAKRKIESLNGYTFEKVFLSVEDHIAVMTLHNPPVNAASGTVQEEILKLCDYINHDDDIWVCIMHSDIAPRVIRTAACPAGPSAAERTAAWRSSWWCPRTVRTVCRIACPLRRVR